MSGGLFSVDAGRAVVLNQFGQGGGVEVFETVKRAFLHLVGPLRIRDQRTPDRDQVKFTLLHALGQGIKTGLFRGFAGKRAHEVR